ncbi:MAG: TRAP transporter small permease [Tistlia sp.]|uniref:TRAP transporter small permease subunit n=1 Tax=Tistlia sp. TaxID=3057121 RepID=UPI0034A4A4A5
MPDRHSDLVARVAAATRAVNRRIAIACGLVLLATGALILVEIALRRTFGGVLGGTDEISGYVMAGIATWGLSWALAERAHVRIDLLQRRLAPAGRATLDALALLGVAAVAALVTLHAWSVLATSLARGSLANTPLETPLWIPQAIWLGGWAWFAVTAWLLAGCLLVALLGGRFALAEEIGGAQQQEEAEP